MHAKQQVNPIAPQPLFVRPKTWEETKALQASTTKLWQEHTARIAKNKYAAVFGKADEDQPANWFIKQVREPKPKTVENYMRRGARAFSRASETGADVWDKLSEHAGSLGAWYTGRAALQFYLLKKLREAKNIIDRMGEPTADKKKVIDALTALPRLANALQCFPTHRPAKFEKGSGFKPVRMTKSRSLRKAPIAWRELVAAAIPEKHRIGWLLQSATGCRPQELENGITVQLQSDGHISLTIAGAKVGERSGQRHRTILLSLKEGGVVQMLADELTLSPQITYVLPCMVDTYRKAVSRCCRKVCPTADVTNLLSAYSARHQRKADWKSAGVGRVDLAKSLGHQTTRSAVHYGANVRGRTGSVKPVAVQASTEVRVRAQFTPRAQAGKSSQQKGSPTPQHRPKFK